MGLIGDLWAEVDVTRAAWGARPSARQRRFWRPHEPSNLEVHHSVTPASWSLEYACRRIQAMHIDNNGWADAFYNVALHPNGRIAELAPWGRISGSGLPAFTVVLLGNYNGDQVTEAQAARLERLYQLLPTGFTYHRERARLYGQPSSECCGTNAIGWVERRRLEPPWPSAPAPSPTPVPMSEEDEMPFVLHDATTNMHYICCPNRGTLRPIRDFLPQMHTADGGTNQFGHRKLSAPQATRVYQQLGYRIVEAK